MIKIPIVWWGDWRWSSRSNWTWKSKFTPFWAYEFVRAISQYQIKWGFPNLDQKCILELLRSLLILGWLILIFSFISNFKPVIFYQILRLLNICSFCIYLVRPSPLSVPHPTWLRTYTDSYACGQSPAMDRETVYLYILVRPLEFSQPRLGNWHWILQAAIGFRHIIYASLVEILYANIDQSPKQQ